jgi:Animal haem peroxidase
LRLWFSPVGNDSHSGHTGAEFLPQRSGVTLKDNAEELLTNVMAAVAGSKAAELDAKMSEALRNILFGPTMKEDLASRNIFRGRELNVPTCGGVAKCLGLTAHAQVCSGQKLASVHAAVVHMRTAWYTELLVLHVRCLAAMHEAMHECGRLHCLSCMYVVWQPWMNVGGCTKSTRWCA